MEERLAREREVVCSITKDVVKMVPEASMLSAKHISIGLAYLFS